MDEFSVKLNSSKSSSVALNELLVSKMLPSELIESLMKEREKIEYEKELSVQSSNTILDINNKLQAGLIGGNLKDTITDCKPKE